MPNAALDAARIDTLCAPDAAASRFAQSAAQRLNWSSRGLHRALKVARTIADLAGADSIATVHVAEALQWRRSLSDATPCSPGCADWG
jgi:magnesium chelatase family protein